MRPKFAISVQGLVAFNQGLQPRMTDAQSLIDNRQTFAEDRNLLDLLPRGAKRGQHQVRVADIKAAGGSIVSRQAPKPSAARDLALFERRLASFKPVALPQN